MTAMKPSLKAAEGLAPAVESSLVESAVVASAAVTEADVCGWSWRWFLALEAGEPASACSAAPEPPKVRTEDRPALSSEQRLLPPAKCCPAAIWGRETSCALNYTASGKAQKCRAGRTKEPGLACPERRRDVACYVLPRRCPETRRSRATSLHQTVRIIRGCDSPTLLQEILQLRRQRDRKR